MRSISRILVTDDEAAVVVVSDNGIEIETKYSIAHTQPKNGESLSVIQSDSEYFWKIDHILHGEVCALVGRLFAIQNKLKEP